MTPIYVPESTGSVSAGDILEDVNMRLDNDLEPRSSEFAGDDVAQILHLPDRMVCGGTNAPFVYTDVVGLIGLDGTAPVQVLIEGNHYTVDYQAGYLTFFSEIPTDVTLYVDYKVRHWSETLLWRLINNGLHYLYPKFYAQSEITPTLGTDGTYPLIDTLGRVVGGVVDVEDVSEDRAVHLSPQRDYRILRRDDEDAYLRVFGTVSGTLTVRIAVHPHEFLTESSTFTDLGLPERMREPLVLYTCWQALTQKMPARSRWDNITTLNTEGKTTFFDHARMVATFKALLDAELQSNNMRPWTSRGL